MARITLSTSFRFVALSIITLTLNNCAYNISLKPRTTPEQNTFFNEGNQFASLTKNNLTVSIGAPESQPASKGRLATIVIVNNDSQQPVNFSTDNITTTFEPSQEVQNNSPSDQNQQVIQASDTGTEQDNSQSNSIFSKVSSFFESSASADEADVENDNSNDSSDYKNVQNNGVIPIEELKVFTYAELKKEIESQKALAALLAGLAGVAQSYSASMSGYQYNSGTYSGYGAGGYQSGTYSGYTYNPGIAMQNQAIANAQMQQNFNSIESNYQKNISQINQEILKLTTIRPKTFYGGKIKFQLPQNKANGILKISVNINGNYFPFEFDMHEQRS